MNDEIAKVEKNIDLLGHKVDTVQLYPSIGLSFISLTTDTLSFQHKPLDNVIEINYCRNGRIGWNMNNGKSIYLGKGDFSLHTMKTCADSVMSLPTGIYEGLTIYIDLNIFSKKPIKLLSETGIDEKFLYDNFCKSGNVSSFVGNEQTEEIFNGFYNQPENLALPYQKLKVLELLLHLAKIDVNTTQMKVTEYQSDQVEIIRQIHKQLVENMNQRFTIETLSKQYHINSTT